ncbi:hypothetical protein F1C10_06785 [Sphingomonas sp. NBWT7]|uniref:hypothetical protein n=1 Tax=Sphingomonas sp. NBWT7 TaxID=2596913 RepID=UPI001624A6FA|nr:hypothetical protein [Sphingomonas sp. NBWT7]QNE31669.1 hypothetical protein F1C10_06785 [Sphingomonas sp. NBWT7]
MRFKNLERYRTGGTGSRMELSIPAPTTPDGRVYRFSPNEDAHPRHFVLGEADRPETIDDAARSRMKLKPGSPQTVCPYSGVVADDDEFMHPEDREAAIEMVRHAAIADVEQHLGEMFAGLARGQSRNSPLRIEVKTDRRVRPRPRFYRSDLLRELVCDHCGRDYGVYAIGLFCPDCGAPNLRLHFAREIDLVEAQVTLADGLDAEHEELAYRLLGNAHEDVLTAFEATMKTVYLFGRVNAYSAEAAPRVGNDFQNVERGQRRFAELAFDPYAALDDAELAAMKLNIQKRHVIGHNLGVVDAKFAEQSGDAGIGETVHLVGEDIQGFARTAQKVVDALDDWLGGVVVPPRERADPEEAEDDMESNQAARLRLSETAFRIGVWLTEHSGYGLVTSADDEALQAALADLAPRDLQDALAELEADGYIGTQSFLNRKMPRVSYRAELFSTFDPIVRGTDPTLDAAEIADLALGMDGTVNVAELHEKTGWELRRFNPALAILVGHVDQRRVGGGGGQYAARYFALIAADRVELKRFVARHAKAR